MHEKTLVHAIQMLTLWSSNFKKRIPKALIMWFLVIIFLRFIKTNLNLKLHELIIKLFRKGMIKNHLYYL